MHGRMIRCADEKHDEPWTYMIWGVGHLSGQNQEGSAKTKERCFEDAKRCWADNLEALGLKDA